MSYERKETKNGYICYVNKENSEEIVHLDLGLQNFIQFKNISTGNNLYRCSGRLHHLRKYLKTQNIPFNLVLSILERHKFMSNDDVPAVKPNQLINLLYDIYYAANKLDYIQRDAKARTDFGKEFDPDELSITLATLFWAIFDPNHCKFLSLLEIKYTLLIFCATNSIEELIQHQFHLSIDHNRCISQTKFKSVLVVLMKILNFLDKSIFCDPETISEIVKTSFYQANCTGLAGLNDSQFYEFWTENNLTSDTEFGFYLNVILKSRKMNSFVVHEDVKCDGDCNDNEIVGLRFRCQKCSKLNLCMKCFLGNFQNKKHNPEVHKIVEVSTAREEKKRNLLTKLWKIFYFIKFKKSVQISGESHSAVLGETPKTTDAEDSIDTITKTNPKDRLSAIIDMLSMENRVFQSNLEQIQKTCNPNTEFHSYLERHKNILTEQIEQLRLVCRKSTDLNVNHLTPAPATAIKFSSTPFRPNLRKINWDLLDLDTPSTAVRSRIIRGEEINKTFFEANRSDRSLEDVSSWLHLRESFCREMSSLQGNLENAWNTTKNDPEMKSFRVLLNKVREILEDTYSDNSQLSTVTQQLETVLDKMIGEEEKRLSG